MFLRLIGKHFPRGHTLNKFFNHNTVKVSYNCLPNMQSIIKAHNARVITQSKHDAAQILCKRRSKESCSLRGECLAWSIIYKATVATNQTRKSYIGLSGGPFKQRYTILPNLSAVLTTERKWSSPTTFGI